MNLGLPSLSYKDEDVCIVSFARTPLGAFGGCLSHMTAPQLGAIAIEGALEKIALAPSQIQEVFYGNVLSANLGQAPATQAAKKAGIPSSVPCTLVNKVCSSGLKAVVFGLQSILTGDNEVVVAGGMESMSQAPMYVPRVHKKGADVTAHPPAEPIDGMVKDGLWDPYNDMHMGNCAELCAAKFSISREEQDEHAITSFERASAAAHAGWTSREIVAVPSASGSPEAMISEDEGIKKISVEKLKHLKPYFKRDASGTVTAGNASPLSDGAAALVLARGSAARRLGLRVLAVIRGWADANQEPEWFTTTPALVIPKALAKAGVDQKQIDYWEINEAFSVVDIANRRLLGLPAARVNVHGGAVALGHPLGASGARIVCTLMNVLAVHGGRWGVAAICNGGGGASALVIEAAPQARM